jgi:hypothetical protein
LTGDSGDAIEARVVVKHREVARLGGRSVSDPRFVRSGKAMLAAVAQLGP